VSYEWSFVKVEEFHNVNLGLINRELAIKHFQMNIFFHLCVSKISKRLSGWELYFVSELASDAHRSYTTPWHSVFHVPFSSDACARELGSAPPKLALCSEKTLQLDSSGPSVVGLAVRIWIDWRSALAIVTPETVVPGTHCGEES
jgi:hypothetical protein